MAEQQVPANKAHVVIDYEDRYVQPLILAAIKARIPSDILVLLNSISEAPAPDTKLLQWKQYESLDLDHVMENSQTSLMNSYIIRKALIRKHYLSTTVAHWLTKHPKSCLRENVKPSVEFELDFAEFLDDALVEAFELRESFEQNEGLEDDKKQWWILKPGMSDRGQGIRLFNSEEDLTAIFESWEEESDDEVEAEHSGDEEERNDDDDDDDDDEGNGVITSQLRHFIAQPYIHPPLLLPAPFASADRKFHIRTYVLALGALKVFVYKPMLALFAGKTYTAPWETSDPNEDLASHLTNTCMQTGEREGSVHAFWSLPDSIPSLPSTWKQSTFDQICKITGQVFEAAARGMMVHFQPLPNAFELFGIDFMMDAEGGVYLLEINAFPDFAQTGDDLNSIVQGLFEEVVDVAIKPFFGLSTEEEQSTDRENMALALDIDLGRN